MAGVLAEPSYKRVSDWHFLTNKQAYEWLLGRQHRIGPFLENEADYEPGDRLPVIDNDNVYRDEDNYIIVLKVAFNGNWYCFACDFTGYEILERMEAEQYILPVIKGAAKWFYNAFNVEPYPGYQPPLFDREDAPPLIVTFYDQKCLTDPWAYIEAALKHYDMTLYNKVMELNTAQRDTVYKNLSAANTQATELLHNLETLCKLHNKPLAKAV